MGLTGAKPQEQNDDDATHAGAVDRLDGQMIWNSAPDDYPTADDALNAAQAAKAEGGPDDPR